MIKWQEILSQNGLPWQDTHHLLADRCDIRDLGALKKVLDAVHIRICLVKPYQESGNYPLVESRELLPSFDNSMYEYKALPGFSLVAFGRSLSYFNERFQYDLLYPRSSTAEPSPRQQSLTNMQIFSARLPRVHQDIFRTQFSRSDISSLANYPAIMPYIVNMDRAHVLSKDQEGRFHLSGIFASFTNDLDTVLKKFGRSIGKFRPHDNELYIKNRMFVYQFLMELYGFPIVSERRTSAAMFARRLQNYGEHFLLRVLGQTDRTITTYTGTGAGHPYPSIEKIALVAVEEDQKEAIDTIAKNGYFLDAEHRVVILRVTYRQHRYDESNIRQDRALSVSGQQIIHPLTGGELGGVNIIRDASNMYLRLNDIVRGEYTGRIIYRRTQIIESTEADEDRLKVITAWLTKHQRRIIDYSDEFFGKINRILTGYLYSPEKDESFEGLRDLHHEACARLGYIQQARTVRTLEDLSRRTFKGERITYKKLMELACASASSLRFDVVNFFPEIVEKVIAYLDRILSDHYLVRTYIRPQEGRRLSRYGMEIRKNYGQLVSLQDELKTVLRTRRSSRAAKDA